MSEIYHILNRSIDKRKIFLDKKDYFRFIHDLFEFNDERPANTAAYHFFQRTKYGDLEGHNIRKPRKMLVNIHAFSLMPNHYHLLLSPRIDNGIPWFMQKLGAGYVKYFNYRYKRKGTIFEGRYKSIRVSKDSHFFHLPYYIHLNPLDMKFKEWREGKMRDYKKAMEYLDKYRWSSHLDYIGIKNFPSITNRAYLTEILGKPEEYRKSIKQWLKDLEMEDIREMVLE